MEIIIEKLLVREIVHFCIRYIICLLFCLKHLKLRLGRKGSLHKPVSMHANEIRGSWVWRATSIPRLSRREQNPRNEIIAGNAFFFSFTAIRFLLSIILNDGPFNFWAWKTFQKSSNHSVQRKPTKEGIFREIVEISRRTRN